MNAVPVVYCDTNNEGQIHAIIQGSACLPKLLLLCQNICQALYPSREMRLHRRDVSLSTDWSARTPLFCVRPSVQQVRLPRVRPSVGASDGQSAEEDPTNQPTPSTLIARNAGCKASLKAARASIPYDSEDY